MFGGIRESYYITFFIFFMRQFFYFICFFYKITFLFKSNRKAIWVCVPVANDLANHSSNIVFLRRQPSVCESLKSIKLWGHFIWKDDTYFWCQVYLSTQGGRGHWTVSYTSSQSYIITFYFSLASHLWDVWNFNCLVYPVECPNVSTTNCNI